MASTASAFVFEGGLEFSATNPQAPPLLTTNIPIGLQFRENAPSSITVDQSILNVKSGQTLALVGGNVGVEGGDLGFLQASGGRVELAGVAGPGTVGLNVNDNELRLSFPVGLALSDVSLTNYALVDVRGGGGGSIAINAQNLNLAGGSGLLAGIGSGLGSVGAQAGDITLNATGAITVAESRIFNLLESMAVGNGGNINITAESLSLENTELAAVNLGRGNAGSILVQTHGSVSLSNDSLIFNSVEPGAEGNTGGINIRAGSVLFTDGSSIQANTYGQGNSGNVIIQARDISFDGVDNDGFSSGIVSTVQPTGVGKAADIQIVSRSLSLTNGALVLSNTRGSGNASNVTVLSDGISIDGMGSNQENSGIYTTVAAGIGHGGDISITTGSLSMTNGGELNTSTYAQGDAGNLTIIANNIFIDGVDSNGFTSGPGSTVGFGGIGKGGNLKVTTGSLLITNGGNLDASTYGQGDAGNIYVDADSITLSGVNSTGLASGLFTFAYTEANGKGGDITVNTNTMRVQNGAVVNAKTLISREGGNVIINAHTFEAANGGEVITSTGGQGKAGNITINAADRVTLSGSDPTYFDRLAKFGVNVVDNVSPASGLFANTSENSTGKGGSISITTGQLVIQDGAQVTASSQGTGDAGDIVNITADSLKLDNGFINTTSRSGQGGNIEQVKVQDLLLMRNGSRISTSAGTNQTGGGDGGNMNINAQFIVAVPKEDSDIQANAYTGKGGQIQITTSGIFGFQFPPKDTPLSDITASSQFGVQGVININTPGIDPSRGLVALPQTVVDPAALVAQNPCVRGKASAFVVTGRGGLPANPSNALSSDTTHVGLVEPASSPHHSSNRVTSQPQNSSADRIVPAMGWAFNDQGQVVLIADNPTNTFPQRPLANPATCNVP